MVTRSLTIDDNNCYIYPMANSLSGGAKASETNIRDLFGVLLSKSSAKTTEDFKPKMDDSQNWYTTSIIGAVLTITFNTIIGPGKGNCNGYYVDLFDKSNPTQNPDGNTNFTFTKEFDLDDVDTKNMFNLQVYFRIIYSGTGICDGVSLWAGTEDEAKSIYDDELKQYGFYDIGILIGTINIDAQDTSDIKVNYNYNENITNCIDINRLGNANGDYVSQLYNKINRLYNLMLDSGFMTVGTVLQNKVITIDGVDYKFNPEPGTHGYKYKDELVSSNKIQMYLKPRNISVENESISGGPHSSGNLSHSQIMPNTIQGYIGETPQDMIYDELTNTVSFSSIDINLGTGEYTINGEVTDANVSYQYNEDGYYEGGLQYVQRNSDSSFSNNQDIIKFKSEVENNVSKITEINICNSIFTNDNIDVKSINTEYLYIKSPMSSNTISIYTSDGQTLTIDNTVYINGFLTVHQDITADGNITGNKVFGAVWQ